MLLRPEPLLAALASTMLFLPVAAKADTADALESQRAAFRAVYPQVERGNWDPVVAHEAAL